MENGRALFLMLGLFLVVFFGYLLGRKFLLRKKDSSISSIQLTDPRVPVSFGV